MARPGWNHTHVFCLRAATSSWFASAPLELLLPSLDHGGCSACVEFDGWCQFESFLRWLLQDCKTETIGYLEKEEEEEGGREGARRRGLRRGSSAARANLERRMIVRQEETCLMWVCDLSDCKMCLSKTYLTYPRSLCLAGPWAQPSHDFFQHVP